MKTSFVTAALLVLIAGIPLSAGATPGEVRQREGAVMGGGQGGDIVLATAGRIQVATNREPGGSLGWLDGDQDDDHDASPSTPKPPKPPKPNR